MIGQYDLIIFDCDGTLTNSEEGYFHAFSETLRKFGFEPPSNEIYQTEYAGKILRDLIDLFFSTSGQDTPQGFAEHHKSLEHKYILEYTRAIEGASEAVAALSQQFPVCIASNATMDAIIKGLTHVGMIGQFRPGIIFSKDHVDKPKPAPDVYLHAAKVMGFDPVKAIIIEDSAAGTKAGLAAGAHVIGFAGAAENVEGRIDNLMRAGANAAFATWPEIVSYISRLTERAA